MKSKRIKQCQFASTVKHSGKFLNFMEMHNLVKFYDKRKPSIFFGMYDPDADINRLKRHKSLAVLIWRGGDIRKQKCLKAVKKMPWVKNVAISSYIEKDLDNVGIPYKSIPLIASPVKHIKPEILGDEIYTYIRKSRWNFYGGDIVKKLKKLSDFKINIITDSNQYSRKKLYKIYKKCFIGLRLTKHDGIANSVIELGLMGRRCMYNGNTPNAIHWERDDINSIMESINNESAHIGKQNKKIASQMSSYIDISDDWLHTDFWE